MARSERPGAALEIATERVISSASRGSSGCGSLIAGHTVAPRRLRIGGARDLVLRLRLPQLPEPHEVLDGVALRPVDAEVRYVPRNAIDDDQAAGADGALLAAGVAPGSKRRQQASAEVLAARSLEGA